MSTTIGVHRVKNMTAAEHHEVSWLNIEDEDGNQVTLFIPYETARQMEEIWARASALIGEKEG